MRIALLEDDLDQLARLTAALKQPLSGFDVSIACVPFSEGMALYRAMRADTFDMLVLDWNVPDFGGMELLDWLRGERNDWTPVIMLTGRSSEKDVACALGHGADDYVSKPFRAIELRARVARLFERTYRIQNAAVIAFGEWEFDRTANAVIFCPKGVNGRRVRIPLTEREFRLAFTLFRNAGKVVSRSHLLQNAGYAPEETATRSLDIHIYRLRAKLALETRGKLRLLTVYGGGYRLEESASISRNRERGLERDGRHDGDEDPGEVGGDWSI